MRYNPYWFEEGAPTKNLVDIYKELRRKVSRLRIDPESLEYHVVGSNTSGSWKGSDDVSRIELLLSKKNLSKEVNLYLSIFVPEIFSYTPKQIEEVISGLGVSDLDLKITGKLDHDSKERLAFGLIGFHKGYANEYWNGEIDVFVNEVVKPPYYSITRNEWTFRDAEALSFVHEGMKMR